jgi:WD40 repeat protein
MGNNVYIGGGYNHLDWVYDSESLLTATYVDSFSVSSQETGPREIAFNSDGTKFFLAGYQGTDVGEYSMSTAWDISTASYTDALALSSLGVSLGVHSLAFNTNGTKMFVGSYQNDEEIHELALSTAWDVSTASYTDAFDISAQYSEVRGLTFNNDGTKMFLSGNSGDDISEYTLTTGFDVSTASYVDALDVSGYDNDPRGIQFNDDKTMLFHHH